jgi:hypothetical protein
MVIYDITGLTSEDIRVYNHMGKRDYIVTQSIKKLPSEEKAWALNKKGFKRPSDDKPVDITKISEDDQKTSSAFDCYLLTQVCSVSKNNS